MGFLGVKNGRKNYDNQLTYRQNVHLRIVRQVGRVSTRIKRKGIGKVLIPFYNS